jgi:23S rRNA pseudouridine2605 synthase
VAEERLQKIIATAGLASRRKAEDLITGGDVSVNGKVVTELGTKADLAHDHIKVFGKLIKPPARMVYIALNKPDSCVTTVTDPEGRKTVMEYVRGLKERVYPVGRLDYHSEGLLLFTNDGEFANRITSAKFHVQKTYLVKVNGNLTVEQQEKFRAGLPISGKRTAPAEIHLHKPGTNPWYEVKLTEGRQNQIRLMFRHLGRLVERLRRVRIGFLELGKLKTGTFRPLTDQEVYKLRRQVGLKDGESGSEDGEGFIKESTPREPYAKPLVARIPKAKFAKPESDRPPYAKPAYTKAPAPQPAFERAEARKPYAVKPPSDRPPFNKAPAAGSKFGRPEGPKPPFGKAPTGGPKFGRPDGPKPAFGKPQFGKSPDAGGKFGRTDGPKPQFGKAKFGKGPGTGPQFDRPDSDRPQFGKAKFGKGPGTGPKFDRPDGDKPQFGKPPFGKPGGAKFGRPDGKPQFGNRSSAGSRPPLKRRNKPRTQS